MIPYIRYIKNTGVITQTGMYPEKSIHLLGDDTHGVIIGLAQDDKHYVKDGKILEYPERPSLDFEWNGTHWVQVKSDAEIIAEKAERLRNTRNTLLAKSDWTQMPDSPLSQEQRQAWADYRQALRDLPQSNLDLDAVKWPQQPEV